MGLFDKLSKSYKNFIGLYEYPTTQNMFIDNELQNMHKSMDMDLQKSEPSREQKALLENPLGTLNAMSYKDKPTSLSYDLLRRMTTKDAVIGAIINTRINQVSAFSQPARFKKDGMGYEIRLRDPELEPSEEDKDVILALEAFLENTGYEKDPYRDSFDTFLRKIVRDRLTFDQIATEIVPDVKGRPAEFYAIDGATIRIASENIKDTINLDEMGLKKADEIKFVQVIEGKIKACFTGTELAFGVANPRTDIQMNGYGFSELEMLIHQVTSHLWAEEYNSKFFSQGGTTKGILNFKGSNNQPVNPEQLEAFKRQWLAQVSGMTGAWKTPVVSVDGLEYINVSQSNREMEFEKWLNYLINICCAIYQIDPSEVNFPNRGGSTGSSGGLGEGGIEDRLQHSKDKGLRPLLQFIEAYINKHIISRFDPKFVFSFVGLDIKSESEKADLRAKDVKTFKTINELREAEGLEPLEEGDIILDPTFMQFLQMKQQEEMQKQMMEQGGGMMGGMGGMPQDEEDSEDDEQPEEDEVEENPDEYDRGDDDEEDTQKSLTKFITIELD